MGTQKMKDCSHRIHTVSIGFHEEHHVFVEKRHHKQQFPKPIRMVAYNGQQTAPPGSDLHGLSLKGGTSWRGTLASTSGLSFRRQKTQGPQAEWVTEKDPSGGQPFEEQTSVNG